MTKTYEVEAPTGYHWMNYDGGPVLMAGPANHELATPVLEFDVVDEGDEEHVSNEEHTEKGAEWDKIYEAIFERTGNKELAAATATARIGKAIEPPVAPMPKPRPEKRRLLFVVSTPSNLDIVRKRHLCGAEGRLFIELYLEPLGISREDVDVIDVGELHEHAERQPAGIVALGKAARLALNGLEDVALPHPWGARREGGSRDMLSRKLEQVRAIVERRPVYVAKADGAKRIVYGIVLDPYIVDAHDDHLSPSAIEETAHDFLASSRTIGLDHNGKIEAKVVESWLHPYPSSDDYKAAMNGEPHKARKTKFGDDVIHSGSWILGVKLEPEQWAQVQAGELNAFSIGGFGTREDMSSDDMPKVQYIDD